MMEETNKPLPIGIGLTILSEELAINYIKELLSQYDKENPSEQSPQFDQ